MISPPPLSRLAARDSFWEAFEGWQSAKRADDSAAMAVAKAELEDRRAPFVREVDAWLLTQAAAPAAPAAESVTPQPPVHLAEEATDASSPPHSDPHAFGETHE